MFTNYVRWYTEESRGDFEGRYSENGGNYVEA
jgi:hypothetical protein